MESEPGQEKPNQRFELIGDELFWKAKGGTLARVLQQGQTEPILFLFHNDPTAGHFGATKTHAKIQKMYYWPKMYEEIKKYVESCHKCQIQGIHRKNNPIFAIEPTGPWKRVGIDFIGPMPITEKGNRYIITAIDYFTRFPEARAVPRATAQEAAKFIYEEIICRHGIVDIIHSDQGTHFNNDLIKTLMKRFDMKHHQITAYHPQSNGLVERLNGTLKKTLVKIMENVNTWDEMLHPALFAYRTAPIESIGTSPAFLEYGREVQLPTAIGKSETMWERIKKLVIDVPIFRKEAQDKLKEHQKRQAQPKRTQDFECGQQVLLRKYTHGWHEPKWEGPYTIIKKYSHGTYQLEDEDGRSTKPINGDHLKLYKGRLFMKPIIVIENLPNYDNSKNGSSSKRY